MDDRRITLHQLSEIVSDWAQHPQQWIAQLQCLATERWSGLLHLDDSYDVWLLSWPVQTGTQLHDHGQSAGAFQVVSGTLEEISFRRRIRRRQLHPGTRVAFPAGAVHDVRNAGDGIGSHAVSIHAYSPPLTSMTYFEQHGSGLTAIASEPVLPPPLLAAPAAAQLVGASS